MNAIANADSLSLRSFTQDKYCAQEKREENALKMLEADVGTDLGTIKNTYYYRTLVVNYIIVYCNGTSGKVSYYKQSFALKKLVAS